MEIVCVLIFGDGSIQVSTEQGINMPSLTTIRDIKPMMEKARNNIAIDDVQIKGYVFNFAVRSKNEILVLSMPIPTQQMLSFIGNIRSKTTKLTVKSILEDGARK